MTVVRVFSTSTIARVGSGVGVDHDLALRLVAGAEEAGGHRPAHVQREVGVEGGGLGGDQLVERERVGEVEVAVDVDEPVGGDLVQVDVEVPLLGSRDPAGLGLGGVVLGAGGVDGALDLRERAAVQHRREVPVHIGGGVHRQGPGLLGDLAGLPDHHLTGQDPGPGAREPVAQLDRVPDVRRCPGRWRARSRARTPRSRTRSPSVHPAPAISRSRSAHGIDSSTGSPGCSCGPLDGRAGACSISRSVIAARVARAAASTCSVRVVAVAAIPLPKHRPPTVKA